MDISEIRLALKDAGYDPIPVIGKRALLNGWTSKTGVSKEEITSWAQDYPSWTNTGILTINTPAFDIDIRIPEAVEAVEEEAREWFDGRGTLPVRFGNPPKRALLFQTAAPFKKMKIKFVAPDGSRHHIEVLGDGQQIVVNGLNPDARLPYSWPRYDLLTIKRADLPEIDEKEAGDFIAYAAEMLITKFGFQLDTASEQEGADQQADGEPRGPVDVEAALAAMRPTGADVNDVQCQVIGAMINRTYHPDDIVSTVVDATMAMAEKHQLDWTRTREIKDVNERVLNILKKEVRGYDHTTGEIPPWLAGAFHQVWAEIVSEGKRPEFSRNRGGYYVRRERGPNGNGTNHGTTEGATGEEPAGKTKVDDDGTFVIKTFTPIDPARLPPRQFLYGKHYQRGTVSGTVAPGGTGKTSQGMVEAIAMATARNLLGEQPEERCRVWLHNGEDPKEELDRRIVAICQHYDIPQAELEGWLFVTSGTELGLKVAHGYSDLKIDAALIQKITKTISKYGFDVFMVDPLITVHGVPESDNGKMNAVIRIFAKMTDVCNCSVDVSHHTRKLATGISEHTADDARGASAFRDAVRCLRILNVMSPDEAGKLGIDEFERLLYFRVDRGKANTAAPAKKAVWRKFESVELANGDNVGVVTAWDRPVEDTLAASAKASAVFLKSLDRLATEDRYVSHMSGYAYAPAVFAKEQEAKAAKIGKAALADAMRALFAAGAIRVEDFGPPSKGKRRLVRASPPTAPHERAEEG